MALAAGDPEFALDTAAEALERYPSDPAVLSWSALLAEMDWRESAAIDYLLRLSRFDDTGELSRGDLMGWIGDLNFRTGQYTESVYYLAISAEEERGLRRRALVDLAQWLPLSRAEPDAIATELPLLNRGLPELRCRVGAVDREFVLDTGASLTTVNRALASELAVYPIIDAGTAVDGLGQGFPVSFGVARELSLGSANLGAVPVLVVEDRYLALRDEFGGAEVAPNGVVGLDILARFRFTFDPERSSVILEGPRGLAPEESVRCVQIDGRCIVPCLVDGQRMWFVLDTGASHSSLSSFGVDTMSGGRRRATEAFRTVRGPGGAVFSVRMIRDVTIQVSGVQFSGVDLPVVTRPVSRRFPVHGVLGFDLLRRARVTFDRGDLRLEAID